jgi:hypothetical protein
MTRALRIAAVLFGLCGSIVAAHAQFLMPGERANQRMWMIGDCTWSPAEHGLTCKSINSISWPSSGTSGGIPYFLTTGSIASSALLAQNAFVIGGGVGGAPATIAVCTSAQIPIGQSGAPSCQTISGDVTITNGGVTAIGANAVSNAKFRQSAALSVVGNCTSSTANVADVTGTANQVLVVNSGGTACNFGQVNLGSSGAVSNVGYGLSQGGGNLQVPLIAAFAQANIGGI